MAFQLGLLVGVVVAFTVAVFVLAAMVSARHRADQSDYIPDWRRNHWKD